jgi:hypothetical protein
MNANRDDETSGAAGQSIWFAIDHPGHGWKRFPLTRALAVGRGEVCLPEFANKVMRTALVHVLLRNRMAVAVSRIELSEWAIEANGRVDQEKAMRRIVGMINGGSSVGAVTPSAADVAAIKRCLGIASGEP